MVTDSDGLFDELFGWQQYELSGIDQALQSFKCLYEGLDQVERIELRLGLERAIMLKRRAFQLPLSLKVVFVTGGGDNTHTVEFSPNMLARAIDAWENGELYTPEMGFGFL